MYITGYITHLLRLAIFCVLPTIAIIPFVAQSAFAAKQGETQQVSAKIGKPLKQARELMDAKKWKEALAKIREVAALPGKTPTEEAIVNEMLAYCMVNLKDYAGAVAIYEKMLASGQFKKEEEPKRILTMSQIYFALQNYRKAADLGDRYLKLTGPNPEVLHQVAQAYFLQDDFAHSEQRAQNLIDLAKKQGKPIEEDWLKLLMSAQYQQNKKPAVVATLEQLLTLYPSDQYWQDMFTYLLADSSFSERESILYLRLVKSTGLLQPDEYVELAELSLAVTNPGEAKAILEEGFSKGLLGKGSSKDRDLKLLTMAREQAAEDLTTLTVTEKEAQAKPAGEALIKVGEAYLGHGKYENAISAFNSGLAKGSVKNKDEVNINLAIAYLGLNKSEDAINALNAVPPISKLALMSRLWLIQARKSKTG